MRSKNPKVRSSAGRSSSRSVSRTKPVSSTKQTTKAVRPNVKENGSQPAYEAPPPRQKGVVFKEPSIPVPSKPAVPEGKGKRTATPSPQSSSSSEHEAGRDIDSDAPTMEMKLDRLVQKIGQEASLPNPEAGAANHPSTSQTPLSPTHLTAMSAQEEEDEEFVLPEGFNHKKLKVLHKELYNTTYATKTFCPAVSVDFHFLLTSFNLNLYPYLGYYEPLLKIRLPYCPSVVRQFYCNMVKSDVLNAQGELVEEGILTCIRGEDVKISPALINQWLGYDNPPAGPAKSLSSKEIFQLLKPGATPGRLNFKPASLSDIHRIVFYIYSRSLVNKAKNFTHITDRDYHFLASILAKEPRNVGALVYEEIRRSRFSSTKATPLPYPQLVSYILKLHGIWYLQPNDYKLRILPFNQTQLNRMRIDVPITGPRTEKPPSKKTRMDPIDEAQSSVAPEGPSSGQPSFAGTLLQGYMNAAIATGVAKLTEGIHSEVQALVQVLSSRFESVYKSQDHQAQVIQGQDKAIQRLTEEVHQLRDILVAFVADQLPSPPDTPIPSVVHSDPHIPSSSIPPSSPPHTTTHSPDPLLCPSASLPPSQTTPIYMHSTTSSPSTSHLNAISSSLPISSSSLSVPLPNEPTFTFSEPDPSIPPVLSLTSSPIPTSDSLTALSLYTSASASAPPSH